MPTVLLTGANGGIGLGFAEVYLHAGWQVLATVRNLDAAEELRALATANDQQLELFSMALDDFASIEALGKQLRGRPIDVLLGNAAKTDCPKTGVGDTDYEAWSEAFLVNSMAPMKLAETFLDNVAASQRKIMYFVSSRIGAKPPAGIIIYRSSKSALNQVVMQLSLMLADQGIIVACGHPGFVKSKANGYKGVFEARESAGYLKDIIDNLTPAGSGKFFDPDGSTLPIVTQQTNPAAFGAKPVGAWDEEKHQ